MWGRRGDERREVIARDATGWVRIEQETGADPWFLIARDGDEEVERIHLLGFNQLAVAKACEAHGWPVSMLTRSDFGASPQVAARPRPRPRETP